MFTKLKNIDTAFKYIRLFSVVFLSGCVAICIYVIYSSHATLNKHTGKVYVLVNGKLVEAVAQDRNIPVEIKDHVATFHTLFFTLTSDEKAIDYNIRKALYLADESAKRQYDNLKEANYYSDIISANISQSLQVDSIALNMDRTPYYFTCHATQIIKRTTSSLTRNLITEGYIRTGVLQSENNNHGFLIERWRILENKDIKQENR